MIISKQRIIDYYDNCQIDYQMLWHLDKNLAMHYGFWDKTTKNLSQALEKENEILAKIAKIKSTDLVLDAGCGVGGSSIYLAKKYGCRVTGITLSQRQVEQAISNAQKNGVSPLVKFYKKDYLKTGFKDKSFDAVWAIESICHAKDQELFVKEAARILKRGGRLIIADYYLTKQSYLPKELKILNDWLKGWAGNTLVPTTNFINFLKNYHLKKINIQNINKNIYRSSQRLYLYSLPGLVIGKLLQILKLRSDIQMGNIYAAHYQYKALKKGLWEYLILYAEK